MRLHVVKYACTFSDPMLLNRNIKPVQVFILYSYMKLFSVVLFTHTRAHLMSGYFFEEWMVQRKAGIYTLQSEAGQKL